MPCYKTQTVEPHFTFSPHGRPVLPIVPPRIGKTKLMPPMRGARLLTKSDIKDSKGKAFLAPRRGP